MPTTADILRACRDTDGRDYKIVICENAETLADGSWHGGGGLTEADFAGEVVRAGVDVLHSHPKSSRVDHGCDRNFAAWHGGRHDRTRERIGGIQWGYGAGWVCTHAHNPPAWLCDLIDAMHEAMIDAACRLGAELDSGE